MGQFLKNMSQNDSKALVSRARQINTQAKIAQETILAKLKNEKATLELKLQDLTDFAPETTQSLRPGIVNWNPEKWAKELHEVKLKLYENSVELQIAESTMKEFFGDEEDADDLTVVEED